MGHWSSGKFSIDYEDEDGEEVNQPTPSLEHEEYLLPMEEPAEDEGKPTEDDREPIDDDEEAAPPAVEEEEDQEEEAPVEEVDNITETIPPGFGPMPRNKKRRLNPPPPNMIMEDEDDSLLE